MASFFVGTADHTATGYVVHDRSRCPALCFGPPDTTEYVGEYSDAAQALAVARLRYGGICHCERRDAAWPWPAPLRPVARAFTPPLP